MSVYNYKHVYKSQDRTRKQKQTYLYTQKLIQLQITTKSISWITSPRAATRGSLWIFSEKTLTDMLTSWCVSSMILRIQHSSAQYTITNVTC